MLPLTKEHLPNVDRLNRQSGCSYYRGVPFNDSLTPNVKATNYSLANTGTQ